jgi:hypothetical protein
MRPSDSLLCFVSPSLGALSILRVGEDGYRTRRPSQGYHI